MLTCLASDTGMMLEETLSDPLVAKDCRFAPDTLDAWASIDLTIRFSAYLTGTLSLRQIFVIEDCSRLVLPEPVTVLVHD